MQLDLPEELALGNELGDLDPGGVGGSDNLERLVGDSLVWSCMSEEHSGAASPISYSRLSELAEWRRLSSAVAWRVISSMGSVASLTVFLVST